MFAVFSLFDLVSAVVDKSSMMFVSGVCSGEEFHTSIFLPAAKLAIKATSENGGHQLHFCNEKDLESAGLQVSN